MARKKDLTPQTKPKKNNFKEVWPQVFDDMQDRHKQGKEKYGVGLQPFNGRNSIVDAYQEVLDQAVYLKQSIIEREQIINLLKRKCVQYADKEIYMLLKELGEDSELEVPSNSSGYFSAKIGMYVDGLLGSGRCVALNKNVCVYETSKGELISERWEDICAN